MTSLTLIFLLGMVSQAAAQIGSSSTTCTDAEWTFFKGKTPCQLWANLQAVCDSNARVAGLDTASDANAQYPIPSDSSATPCQCNVVAYNLMAACTWCQPSFHQNWVSEEQWKNGCSNYESPGLPPPASPLSSEIPSWAFTTQNGKPWLPSDASRIAGASPTAAIQNRQLTGTDFLTNTNFATGTGFPTATPTFRATPTGFSSITRPTTSRFSTTRSPVATFRDSSFDIDPDSVSTIQRAIVICYFVALGYKVVFVVFGAVTLLVWYRRRNNRMMAIYGPAAQFYRDGGRWVDGGQTILAPNASMEMHAPVGGSYRDPSPDPSLPPALGPDILNYGHGEQDYVDSQRHYGAYTPKPTTYPPYQPHGVRL